MLNSLHVRKWTLRRGNMHERTVPTRFVRTHVDGDLHVELTELAECVYHASSLRVNKRSEFFRRLGFVVIVASPHHILP